MSTILIIGCHHQQGTLDDINDDNTDCNSNVLTQHNYPPSRTTDKNKNKINATVFITWYLKSFVYEQCTIQPDYTTCIQENDVSVLIICILLCNNNTCTSSHNSTAVSLDD